MNSIDFIKMSLEMSKGWIMGLAEEIKDSPLTVPTPRGGNHPLWCIGHLAYSEGNLVSSYIKGQSNPLADWAEVFGQGTQPGTDASNYPSIDEVFTKMEEIRAQTLEVVEGLTDDDLDKPSHAPDEMKQFFGSIGQCLAAIPIHFSFHGGQIADARRAAGRNPVMG